MFFLRTGKSGKSKKDLNAVGKNGGESILHMLI